MDHGRLTGSNIHSLVAYVYNDQAGREGATGFETSDVGKLAFQSSDSSYWLLTAVTPVWVQLSTGAGGGGGGYFPLVSGSQQAGSTYTLLGAIPLTDWVAAAPADLALHTLVQIPSGSSAQIRVYDVTNTVTLFESAVVAGPQTNYDFGPQTFAAPRGSAVIEFWLATPTITGGPASCLAAGLQPDDGR